MQIARSWMFVPGHRQKMIDKALGLELDVAVLDLEDGVPAAGKEMARERVAAALEGRPGRALRFARVHRASSSRVEEDLSAAVRPGLDGLVLSKVEGAEDVLQIDGWLQEQEKKAGFQEGHIQLLATIESARGLIQAPAIAASCPRMAGLMFGAEDFALDLGLFAVREGRAKELLYARSALVVAAASQGLQAVDRVCLDIHNPDGLRRDTQLGRELGFTGKGLIHPGQIEVVDQVFRPTAEEVEFARRVVQAFEEAREAGQGAVAVDGQMVDLPIVERARRVLEAEEEFGGRP